MNIPIRSLVLSLAATNCAVERDGVEDAGDEESTSVDGGTSSGSGGGSTSGGESSGESSESTGEPLDPDACGEMWAKNYCETPGGSDGVRFCGMIDGQMRWGACARQIECWPGDIDYCVAFEDSYDYRCELDEEGMPEWVQYGEGCFTPLVLRFEETARIELAYADGYSFDISGTGSCLASDWPTAGTPWLALDRDGDGIINDARELFGSGVVLNSGDRARDGFAALAEHDVDGDGWITAADPVWPELLLWSDHDADRRSTAWELEPLAGRGVTELALEVHVDRRCDERGNCEVERSSFTQVLVDGRSAVGEIVDVHLACQ